MGTYGTWCTYNQLEGLASTSPSTSAHFPPPKIKNKESRVLTRDSMCVIEAQSIVGGVLAPWVPPPRAWILTSKVRPYAATSQLHVQFWFGAGWTFFIGNACNDVRVRLWNRIFYTRETYMEYLNKINLYIY